MREYQLARCYLGHHLEQLSSIRNVSVDIFSRGEAEANGRENKNGERMADRSHASEQITANKTTDLRALFFAAFPPRVCSQHVNGDSSVGIRWKLLFFTFPLLPCVQARLFRVPLCMFSEIPERVRDC